jgi:hypothetical protein
MWATAPPLPWGDGRIVRVLTTEDKPTQEPVLPRRIKPEDVRVGMIIEQRNGVCIMQGRVVAVEDGVFQCEVAWLRTENERDDWSLWLVEDEPAARGPGRRGGGAHGEGSARQELRRRRLSRLGRSRRVHAQGLAGRRPCRDQEPARPVFRRDAEGRAVSRLDKIKARADAATKGPWLQDGPWWTDDGGPEPTALPCVVDVDRALVVFPPDATDVGMKRPEDRAANMAFIAAAREDVPWLIERIGELIGAICWDTTCLNCSSLLDSNYDQYMRAEIAEAEVERLTAERDALAAQVARLAKPGDSDARMDAYYYGFTRTGVGLVDDILSAVAKAGKSYHGTDMWNEELSEGGTCESRIQDAADAAAEQIRAALSDTDADTDADTTDTQPTDQEEQ